MASKRATICGLLVLVMEASLVSEDFLCEGFLPQWFGRNSGGSLKSPKTYGNGSRVAESSMIDDGYHHFQRWGFNTRKWKLSTRTKYWRFQNYIELYKLSRLVLSKLTLFQMKWCITSENHMNKNYNSYITNLGRLMCLHDVVFKQRWPKKCIL